jgi:hypothetical protein
MQGKRQALVAMACVALLGAAALRFSASGASPTPKWLFPAELTHWAPARDQPVFAGAGGDAWDQKIHERGWILLVDGTWHLWYTGYNPSLDSHGGIWT